VSDRCAYCGDTNGPFAFDHVVPRSRNGPDSPRNLVRACAKCNGSKSDRLPSEWLETVPPLVAAIEARITSAVEVRVRRQREGRRGARGRLTCEVCKGTIRSRSAGVIEVHVREIRGNGPGHGPEFDDELLGAPRCQGDLDHNDRLWLDAVFMHSDCNAACAGYVIPMNRLDEDWERHIQTTKWWWFEGIAGALDTARAAFNVVVTERRGMA
jgi:hypothetical protein